MTKLLEAEFFAFAKMAEVLDHAVKNPPSTDLAIEPLERSLFTLGYSTGVTYAMAQIADYRLSLLVAMSEETQP